MAGDWVLGADWASLEAALARRLDLEGSASASRALVRRRGIDSAATLLRLALVYGGTDLSLRGTAFWAEAAGVADLSDVALMYRLQGAEGWLAGLAQTLLGQEIGALGASLQTATKAQGWRVRLVDGTSLMAGGPGKGYHLHACFDLAAQQFDELVLTSAPSVRELGAESLARHTAGPGEILIADRNFAKAAGVRAAVAQGGELIVRRGLTACRIEDEQGRPLDAAAILALAEAGTAGEQIVDTPVWLPATDDAPTLQLRVIIQKKPPEAAEKSQKRATKKAQRHPTRPSRSNSTPPDT